MTAPARLLAPLALLGLLAAADARPAAAAIGPPRVLDGPGAAVLDVGGAALAPDGTGGVVYRRAVDGVPHLFVVRFARGGWSAPIRVDAGRPFAAASPAIAAAENGRLLVVWTTPWAVRRDRKVHHALMGAVLAPGARGFGPAIEVDPRDAGDGSAAGPSLSIAPGGGGAYVVYRVVTNALDADTGAGGIAPMRPGDQVLDVRVARFNGLTWSSLGAVNRLQGRVTMRRPTAANAPEVAVNRRGDAAVVVWQEPGVDGVARIWARRLFGTTAGTILPVSPATLDGRAVLADADAPALAVSELSEAKVAFRLRAATAGASERLLLNTLPPSTDDRAGTFAGADAIDAAPTLSPPSVALDADSGFRLGWVASGSARVVSGDVDGREQPRELATGVEGPLPVTHDPDGGGVAAWTAADNAGLPIVRIRQERGDGGWQQADASAPLSGAIDGLSVGGSDRGDALVAFRQGPQESSQLVAALATSQPSEFAATTPSGWLRPASARVSWSAARTIAGRPTYAVLVDGQRRASGLLSRSHRIPARGLGDGVHLVEVLASDGDGQERLSAAAQLRIDANPPLARVRRAGRRTVAVEVRDAGSGVRATATRIDFGERGRGRGGRAAVVRGRARARHTYRNAGRYVVTVRCRDKVGRTATWRVRVEAR